MVSRKDYRGFQEKTLLYLQVFIHMHQSDVVSGFEAGLSTFPLQTPSLQRGHTLKSDKRTMRTQLIISSGELKQEGW